MKTTIETQEDYENGFIILQKLWPDPNNKELAVLIENMRKFYSEQGSKECQS